MAENDNLLMHRKWDSDFFGKRIYSLDLTSRSEDSFESLAHKALEQSDADLIYLFSDRLLGENPVPVDTKITLCIKDPSIPTQSSPNQVISYAGESYDQLLSMVYESGKYSRFKVDERFSDREYRALYKEWIDRSIDKTLADDVLIVSMNSIPAGFITYKLNENSSTIGLIAVDQRFRGKGIAKALINEVVRISAEKSLREIFVTTQGANQEALGLYDKMLFRECDRKYIYHIWKN